MIQIHGFSPVSEDLRIAPPSYSTEVDLDNRIINRNGNGMEHNKLLRRGAPWMRGLRMTHFTLSK